MASEQLILREVSSTEPNAMSLRRARELHLERDGLVTNPRTGAVHRYSLSAWADRDPDNTFLLVGVRFVDPDKVGTVRRRETPGQGA